MVDDLIESFNKTAKSSDDALNLRWQSRRYFVTQKQQENIDKISSAIYGKVRAMQMKTMQLYSEADPVQFSQHMKAVKNVYGNTAMWQWFQEAQNSIDAYIDCKKYLDRLQPGRGIKVGSEKKIVKSLRKVLNGLTLPLFQDLLHAQIMVLESMRVKR